MIAQYLGFDSDIIIIALVVIAVILLILTIVNIVQMSKLKKNYKIFMSGKDANNLEEVITKRFEQIDGLLEANHKNETEIEALIKHMKFTYQKMGLYKYDAFSEMGGKLSFSLAMLDGRNSGYIINAMHTREGCYTYIKEIIDGNSIIVLSQEEQEALQIALKADNSAR